MIASGHQRASLIALTFLAWALTGACNPAGSGAGTGAGQEPAPSRANQPTSPPPSGTGGAGGAGGTGGTPNASEPPARGAGGSGGSAGAPASDASAPEAGAAQDAATPTTPTMPAMPEDETGHLGRVVPVLLITVDGKAIPRDVKIPGRIKVIEDHDGTLANITSRPATLDAPIGIELRGQSSFSYDQKPMGIEVRDDKGEGVAVPLLGLPAEADFVLHSCYADKTCMRNALTYAVAREIGTAAGRWAPRTRYVEVFVDGKYQGLYLLVERIKRDKSRVNIHAPAKDTVMGGDLSGGYIFSQEGDGGRTGADWPSPFEIRAKLVYRYPKGDVITPAQKAYLQQAAKGLADAITGDPGVGEATRAKLDVASAVDYEIIQELTNNVDAYWKSWFFYKAPAADGGRFVMGPVWDFDIGYGNVIFKKRYCANTSAVTELRGPFAALYKKPAFIAAVRCRWNALRAAGGPLALARLEEKIEAFAKHIAKAKARDVERWKNIGFWVWPNNYIGGSWQDEVTYLRYWLRKRLAWLDGALPGQCADTPEPGPVELIPAPPKVMERNMREPYIGRDAPVYIPIEGQLPANLAAYACPR
jgi:CotH kinase protein